MWIRTFNARSYNSVTAILRSGKDKVPAAATLDAPILFHPNIHLKVTQIRVPTCSACLCICSMSQGPG